MSRTETPPSQRSFFPSFEQGVAGWPDFEMQLTVWQNIYMAGCETAARFMEDQASYLKNLADCKSPSDIIVCQAEFTERSCKALVKEGLHATNRFSSLIGSSGSKAASGESAN